MKGRERNKGAPPADLLVCFPTRSHLKLMPKPTTCSPSRPSAPTKRFLQYQHRHLKKSAANSSMLLLKNKHMESDMSEPTSPKVTCAGQIKVRPKNGGSCKNWQSVMEEIEKLHNHNKKNKKIKKPNWAEALGFKKDVMQFLTCLRTIRFDFRCFGSFPSVDITSSDDEDDDEDEDEDKDNAEGGKYEHNQDDDDDENENENSKAVFSKWFMVLQENQDTKEGLVPTCDDQNHSQSANVPPSNALLLMRCRSAPAKSWLEEREEDEVDEEEEEEKEEKEAKMVNEEEVKRKKILDENNLVVMKYDTDFYKLSCDIAKETWVVGGMNKDQMSRSRSCKR
ncbi:uncharacterized protein LOC141711484 [Apium graveolens]|uniref:uncharacterized protein LOC141711484 n=1 Tax=Apium graveolens TaxID=4045 RepID=UPI003D78D4CB